jgi:surface antigen
MIRLIPLLFSFSLFAQSDQILEYCLINEGKTVGNGNCVELVSGAMKYAHVHRWQRKLTVVTYPEPGDILTMESCKDTAGVSWTAAGEGHVAIVKEIFPDHLVVYQQNANGSAVISSSFYYAAFGCEVFKFWRVKN